MSKIIPVISLFLFVALVNDAQSLSMDKSSVTTRDGFFRRAVGTSSVFFSVGGAFKPRSVHANDLIPPNGSRAPAFELPNSRGEGVTSLDTLTKDGKWTVLYFYPGAFTSGCTLEARNFQKDIESYRKLNAKIVGVSVDPVEKNAQFCSTESLEFYMLSDKSGIVSTAYGSALSVPGFGTFSNRQTYLIDPKGFLRWVFTDVEQRIPSHSSEVLSKLTEFSA